MIKNMPANARDLRDTSSIPGLGRFPGREWLPIPVFLPGEFCVQKSLAGYSSWGCKESDTLDHKHFNETQLNFWAVNVF